MQNFKTMTLLPFIAAILFSGCVSKSQLKKDVAEVIKEDPKILIQAIEANPAEFVEAITKAAKQAQSVLAKRRAEEEQKKLEETYDKPLAPVIVSSRASRGSDNAPITLVEYSDFECPYCTRGYQTVTELIGKYGKNIKFIYKHLPLDFHPAAMPAAAYFEAINLQSSKKAYEFHDEIFKQQGKLKKGTKFLDSIAKKLRVDMARLRKDIKSKKVTDIIKEDIAEANKFGIRGTPGFIINGVPVKGAYPTSHFIGIIDELKKRGKIKL
ncbi:MAG: thioredoxin domain-containing protein [Halobacteriovoraceae bacterium]|jgi:protein-disulfide isomerase|nr:thioredoxin domain-containing protein [Halobacteriovoraceae bacterium]MBT5095813.1 thioredoxin domain-containing protein [Halobacteriovoraceae bacterium]